MMEELFHTDWLGLESNGTGLVKMMFAGQPKFKPKSSIEVVKPIRISQQK